MVEIERRVVSEYQQAGQKLLQCPSQPHSCAVLSQGVRYVEGGLPLLTPRLRWKVAVETASSSAQLAVQVIEGFPGASAAAALMPSRTDHLIC